MGGAEWGKAGRGGGVKSTCEATVVPLRGSANAARQLAGSRGRVERSAGPRRVVRGGGWEDLDAADLRASARASLPPDARLHDVGFRCVRDLPGDQRSPTQ